MNENEELPSVLAYDVPLFRISELVQISTMRYILHLTFLFEKKLMQIQFNKNKRLWFLYSECGILI